jgi:DNA-binding transcriptional regulator LsrR (DeoR family)
MNKDKKLPSVETIKALLKVGMTQSQIAIKYGVSRQAVSKLLIKVSKSGTNLI